MMATKSVDSPEAKTNSVHILPSECQEVTIKLIYDCARLNQNLTANNNKIYVFIILLGSIDSQECKEVLRQQLRKKDQ